MRLLQLSNLDSVYCNLGTGDHFCDRNMQNISTCLGILLCHVPLLYLLISLFLLH